MVQSNTQWDGNWEKMGSCFKRFWFSFYSGARGEEKKQCRGGNYQKYN